MLNTNKSYNVTEETLDNECLINSKYNSTFCDKLLFYVFIISTLFFILCDSAKAFEQNKNNTQAEPNMQICSTIK